MAATSLPIPAATPALPAPAADLVSRTRPRAARGARPSDPYHILVSEMMLQQTQVDRVLPKYHEWLEKYPSLEALAAAAEDDVTETWRPLGYNIRPRRLQSIARESVDALRRPAAVGPRDAAVVQGHRRLHRGRHPQLRVRPARRHPRHQRRARALSRVRRPGRHQGARDAQAAVGHLRGARAAQARLRLQSGADGFRRHGLRGAEAEVRRVPDDALVHVVPAQGCVSRRQSRDHRRRRGHRGGRRVSRHAAAEGRAPRRPVGVSRRQDRRGRDPRTRRWRREIREELDTDVDVGELVFHVTHAYDDRTVALYFYRCTLRGTAAAAARPGDAMGAARRARDARLSAGRRGADQAPDRIRRSVTVAGTRPGIGRRLDLRARRRGSRDARSPARSCRGAATRRRSSRTRRRDPPANSRAPAAGPAPSMRRLTSLRATRPCPRCSTRMMTSCPT